MQITKKEIFYIASIIVLGCHNVWLIIDKVKRKKENKDLQVFAQTKELERDAAEQENAKLRIYIKRNECNYPDI